MRKTMSTKHKHVVTVVTADGLVVVPPLPFPDVAADDDDCDEDGFLRLLLP